LRALSRRDPRLGAWLRRVPPLPDFPRGGPNARATHYQALARSITYQQLSGKAAGTIWRRASSLGAGGGFPAAAELLKLSMEELRGAGLSRNKVLALQDLAQRCEDGRLRLRSIGRHGDEEVIEELCQVRGIGVWTAQMFLLFKLGRLDVLAPGDLGLQEGLRVLDGLAVRPTPVELAARGEVWAPLRSVASWTLWRLLEEAR
jgi:DNA-3-methyladenine glycosylase II